MQIDLLKGSLLCTLEHGEMHYMTGREDLDAPRFCRHIIFKVILKVKPIYVIRHHWLVLKFGNNILFYTIWSLECYIYDKPYDRLNLKWPKVA